MPVKNGRAGVYGPGMGRPSNKVRAAARRGSVLSSGALQGKYKRESDYYPVNWPELSFQIRQRDGFRCQIHKLMPGVRCSAYFPPPFHGGLVAHHIEELWPNLAPYGDNPPPELLRRLNSPSNLVSLCSPCHRLVHPHLRSAKTR